MQVFYRGNGKQSSDVFILFANCNSMPLHKIIKVLDFENNQSASKINIGYFAIMLQLVQLANTTGNILRCLVPSQITL